MGKLVRVHDSSSDERRITFIVSEETAPGCLSFLADLPYGKEGPFIRGLIYQWLIANKDCEDLTAAVDQVLSGPGGDQRRGGIVQSKKKSGPKSKIKFKVARQESVDSVDARSDAPEQDSPSKGKGFAAVAPTESETSSAIAEKPVTQPTPKAITSDTPNQEVNSTPPTQAQTSTPEKLTSNIMPLAPAPAISLAQESTDDLEDLDRLDSMFG